MFKFKGIRPTELEKINAIKGGSGEIKHFADSGGAQTDLVMPHDSYVIGLSSLQSLDEPNPHHSGLRVIDASDKNFNTIFDLHTTKGQYVEPQMLNDRTYIKAYESAFDRVLKSGMEEENYEVRALKVPSLHVDAIWLHRGGTVPDDRYVPVKTVGLFEKNKMYDKETFFTILRDAARDYDLNDQELGG